MTNIERLKLVVLIVFVAGVVAFLLTDNAANHTAEAFSSGPPAGYTRAPGEEPESCAECHVMEATGTGQIRIDAPQNYVPGGVYQVTVTHVNDDITRRRWGFQLTALDGDEERAGTLEPLDNFTQVISGQGPFPNRQYIEHTSAGTFFNQTGGASWTFRWVAPATDVGHVTFYAAGNHANGDQNSSGDNIYFTFVSASPTVAAPDFNVSVAPPTRLVTPGGVATYDVQITPSAGFTGTVDLSVDGLPPGASATLNPASVNVNSPSAQTSVLTVTTDASTPLGSYLLNVNATSGATQHAAAVTLVVADPASSDLSITKTDSPDPVPVRNNLTYRITVTNNGPAAATGVSVTDALPPGVNFISATPAQGSCSGTATVTCALGDLGVGASTTINIVVQPQNVGQLSNTASVTSNGSDPVASNDSATATTSVELQGSSPRMLAPNLDVRTIAGGFEQPTGLAFLGANEFFVIEKASGKVLRVAGGVSRGAVLDLAVNHASERGLLGVALHPNFASNNFVYLFWTESTTGADTSDTAAVPLLGNRVDRYVWNGSTLTFDRNLVRLRAAQADAGQPLRGNHNGGVLRFGPDGKLYVLFGDNGRRGFMQNVTTGFGPSGKDDDAGGPEPDDAHLTGVILRLNDDGSVPSDNPFFDAATGLTGEAAANVRKVFAYGVRNGFGMAFDPSGGKLWTQENGDDAFDEINRVEPGFNGGWIQVMGPLSRIGEYKSIEVSRAGGLQQLRWPPSLIADNAAEALQRLFQLPGSTYTDPQFSWKYAVAPSPLGFAAGQGLGPQYAGDMFVGASRATLLNGYLFRFELSGDRLSIAPSDPRLADGVADNADKFDLAESESLVVGRDFGITTDIQTGLNGNLYVVSLSNGAVYEIFARRELFVADLDAAQEVPPTNSSATGTATLVLDVDGATARVSLDFRNLSSAQTGAHIHGPAPTTANAGIVFELPAGNFDDFQITLTPQQVRDLRAGLFYVNVHSQNFPGGEIRGQFGGPAAAPSIARLSAASTSASEGAGSAILTVTRAGDTTAAGTVDYATADGTASERTDYTTARGTLRFEAGERSKTCNVLITDDAYVENSEVVNITLSNPTGGVTLAGASAATLIITDNDSSPSATNPIDDTEFFVRQHYHDFLNREPDAAGLAFWRGGIEACGADQQCRQVKRIDTSAAFFLSIEFQGTGYFVYLMHEASFDRQPRFLEFLAGTQEVRNGVVVGQGDWRRQLEANRQAYTERWVERADFRAVYDPLSNAQYVDELFDNAGFAPADAERDALVAGLDAGSETSATVLRKVVEHAQFAPVENNRAFVLAQYFGYLRRNPDDPPDNNFGGYNFWLGKLNAFGGDYRRAEMVKAFITSFEYRQRFGAP